MMRQLSPARTGRRQARAAVGTERPVGALDELLPG